MNEDGTPIAGWPYAWNQEQHSAWGGRINQLTYSLTLREPTSETAESTAVSFLRANDESEIEALRSAILLALDSGVNFGQENSSNESVRDYLQIILQRFIVASSPDAET